MSKPLSILIGLIVALTACTGPDGSIDGQPTAPGGAPVTFPPAAFPPVTFPPPGGQPLPAVGLPLPTFPPPGGQPLPTFPPPDVGQPEPLPPPDIGQPLPTFPPPDIGQPVDGSGRPPIHFTPQAIWDPAAGNVPAVTFLMPAGWQAEGNVVWMHEWARLAHLHTRISDPSTGVTIEWLPLQDFIYFQPPAGLDFPIGGNYQGKAFVPPVTDPVQFVRDFWMPGQLAHLQGGTLVRVDPVPVVAEEFKRQFGGPAESAAYRLRYAFQQNGQLWEEDVFLAFLYAGSAEIVSWYVNFAYSVRAPKGEIDRNHGVISTVVASRTTTAEWEGTYRLVQELFRQGIRQQMADTAAFGRTLAEHRAASQALQQQVTEERNASQDRIADLRRETLGGVDTYIDPINQRLVQLPSDWVEYWVNPQGEFLTSDTPGFDPNSVDNRGWQRLQPRDR